MMFLESITAMIAGRSRHWLKVAKAHLEKEPACRCCGRSKRLQVHHILPFHLFPENELDPDNLITLCTDGPGGLNCHLVFGHLGHWDRWNRDVANDADRMLKMLHREQAEHG